jgi:NADH:ubiquinone oxidoreductase subunit
MDRAQGGWHNALAFQFGLDMKRFLLLIFTWWNSATAGTLVWTWLFGEVVGEDEFGNRYYRRRGGRIDPALGFERRWVVYNGYADPSTVPPSWHGWLHHTVDTPPTQESYTSHVWQKPHRSNMTGAPGAYRPTGSTLSIGRRPRATGDYRPWTPPR